ncbi:MULTISPECIES: metal ABC transporter substrate-binding protein [unclassified Clostridium]|uniref:metal ABC transporter substrate-binding protein n=1 Tax=unclassified Clostridium TaxID=2614128 RepID=UPI0025C56D5B|nr:zinc ABC transporter substrate-binding protein [Clostridium sp.]MCI6692298.1 zinc ABC transporter substrate-binding protein [Clostridium sp.]MDY2631522.1 zinc ABC transporter substrate-binding protein [Clostridium sp.]MDY4252301.1 zinc ABC transporter substrate-binding protein [Clostridium sp.]
MKKLTYAFLIFTSILFFGLTFSYNPLMANPTNELDEEKDTYLNILTVNKEIYSMVKALTLDNHNVEYLFSNEKEIKDFKVSENIINNILNMDLFIYNGVGYEKWINEIVDNSKNSNVGIINASRGIRTITKSLSKENEENPYYLLGFNEYKIALYNIKTSLQEKDIKNRSYYEENYNKIIDELDKFLSDSKEELKKYKNYNIYTNTDKFDYLFRDLGLQVNKLKDNDEEVVEDKLTNNIFIYDNNFEKLDELKSKMKNEYTYVGLSSEGNKDVLIKNVTDIIEALKNKRNISS